MADIGRMKTYSKAEYYAGQHRRMYVYGSAALQPETVPKQIEKPKKQIEKPKKQSAKARRQVRKNRKRAQSITPVYAVFLTGAAIFAVCISVMFLQLQAEVVSRSENITALQEKLSNLTEENDTAYRSAEDAVNLEEVRDKAINEFGMVYAAQGSVVEYTGPESDSVTQYSDIPKDGVLAKSKDVSE